jgi:hypothetical protein
MTIERSAPASLGQRLLGIMEHYRGGESPLNVPAFYRVRGDLDLDALGAALDTLVARHEALRTTYETAGRRLVQHVHEPAPVPVDKRTASTDPAELAAAMRERARAPFDLAVAPLRVTAWELAPDDVLLMLNIHHLSTDGWSGGVLADELGRLYRPGATPPALPEASWQYVDFSEWQRERYESGQLGEHQRFWREQLEGARPPSLPSGQDGGQRRPGTEIFRLPEPTSAGLAELCRTRRTTTFVAGLAVFAAVLHARTGDTDFGLASMFANRIRPELAGTVGFLTNLVVLRLVLPRRPTFDDVLAATRDMVLDALAYQEIPYHLVPPGDRGAGLENILFQVMAGPEYQLNLTGLDVEQVPPPGGTGSRFDLEFALLPTGSGIDGIVWFDQRRFAPDQVRRLIADFTTMADGVTADPGRPVAEHVER